MNETTIAEENFVDFGCPACGGQNSFPASCAGTLHECVACMAAVIVPRHNGDPALPIPMPISTSHLTLRKFSGADWKDALALFTDDEFFNASWLKSENEEEVVRWIEADSAIKWTTRGTPFVLAIELKSQTKIIGYLSINFTDQERWQANLFVILQHGFQRQGLGAEAARGIMDFCFHTISLHRIQGFCDGPNAAGCALFKKIGMRREGEFVGDHQVNGVWTNTACHAILREEFGAAVPA